jgi:signal transduction histidine kinase/CheY-like chemotaxis protein
MSSYSFLATLASLPAQQQFYMDFSQFLDYRDRAAVTNLGWAVLYAPLVKHADRPEYEALGSLLSDTEDFAFRESSTTSAPFEAGAERKNASEYAPVLFTRPYNPHLQGMDVLLPDSFLGDAIQRAERSKSAVMLFSISSSRVTLVAPVFNGMEGDESVTGFLVSQSPSQLSKSQQTPLQDLVSKIRWVGILDATENRWVLEAPVVEKWVTDAAREESRAISSHPVSFFGKDYILWAEMSEQISDPKHQQVILLVLTLGLFATFFAIVVIMEIQNYRSTQLRKKMAWLTAKRATDRALAASRVLSSISHDIRTPMNGIMGAIQLLKEEPLSEQQHEYTDICMRCSDSLLHLINDYLDFNKLESGTLVLHPIPSSVEAIFSDVAAIYVLKSKEECVTLDFLIADCVPEEVDIDPWRVKQVIINLITNSFKFTPRGGQILVEARILDAEATGPSSSERFLQFSVTDTGIGIAEEDIEGIFKPFRQLESGRRDFKGEGVGLGLSICRELVSGLMGGTIVCTSIPNVKTTFRFTVQLQATLSPPALDLAYDRFQLLDDTLDTLSCSSCTTTSPMDGAAVDDHPVFLAVDDSSVNLRVLVRYLETGFDGCTVLTAVNGREAVKIYAARGDISLCFMDLNMPVMDGMESCRQIRLLEENEGRTACKIIALTAAQLFWSDPEKLRFCGFDKILTKPTTKDGVLSAVRSELYSDQQVSSQGAKRSCYVDDELAPVS